MDATAQIAAARTALAPQLAAAADDAYPRAHASLVRAQQLAELEEVVEYHLCLRRITGGVGVGGAGAAAELLRGLAGLWPGDGAAVARARCDAIRTRWRQRLRTCSRELREWMLMVEVRAMALAPSEQAETWVKFASLCRSARLELCRASLSKLLPPAARRGERRRRRCPRRRRCRRHRRTGGRRRRRRRVGDARAGVAGVVAPVHHLAAD